MTNDLDLWQKAAAFHGHICPGLAIGFKAALYARQLLQVEFSRDEEIVCVTENDACGVDAIQVVLGCSAGKGNLLFRPRGKQAFSFFSRQTGLNIRLVFKELPPEYAGASKEVVLNYIRAAVPEELFYKKEAPFALPDMARIFTSVPCVRCGEKTAENHIRLFDGKKYCEDCFPRYSRIL